MAAVLPEGVLVQNGHVDPFWSILVHRGPFWLVPLGPPTVLWPFLITVRGRVFAHNLTFSMSFLSCVLYSSSSCDYESRGGKRGGDGASPEGGGEGGQGGIPLEAKLLHIIFRKDKIQGGSATEPEPETGTVGTVFPETESGTGTAGTVFQEPKPEPEPFFPVKLY